MNPLENANPTPHRSATPPTSHRYTNSPRANSPMKKWSSMSNTIEHHGSHSSGSVRYVRYLALLAKNIKVIVWLWKCVHNKQRCPGFWYLGIIFRSKTEVLRDVPNSEVRKQDKFMRDWSRHQNTCKSLSGKGPGVRRSKRPLLVYRNRCKWNNEIFQCLRCEHILHTCWQ